MKKHLFTIILCFSLIILISASFQLILSQKDIVSNEKNIDLNESAAWNVSPFVIDELGGGNFTWAEATAQAWCSGNGTSSKPYVIENITMDVGGTGNGIMINNSIGIYFEIIGCTVYNAGIGTFEAGVKLENTTNGLIIYNNCSNNGQKGVFLENFCENNTIWGNIACNSGTTNQNIGIGLRTNCNNNTISNNIVNNNTDTGIYVRYYCHNNTISDNKANYNVYAGIGIDNECEDNIVSRNTADENGQYGIFVDFQCINNLIAGNDFQSNGVHGIFLNDQINNTEILENFIYFNGNGAIDVSDSTSFDNILRRNVLVNTNENFIDDTATNTIYDGNYYLTTMPTLFIDILPQTESLVYINVSSQCVGLELSVNSIDIWWNGVPIDASSILELDNGLYQVTLSLVTSEALILLNMTISEPHHQVKYHEIYLPGNLSTNILEWLLIVVGSISVGLTIALIIALKKR